MLIYSIGKAMYSLESSVGFVIDPVNQPAGGGAYLIKNLWPSAV